MPEEKSIKKDLENPAIEKTVEKKETPLAPEAPATPEIELEKGIEKSLSDGIEKPKGASDEMLASAKSAGDDSFSQTPVFATDERKKQIEDLLAFGLEDFYLRMSLSEQDKFKTTGEKTADEINGLLNKTRVKVKKIINLIKKWLSLIPGVSRFFLEQEAKIKADRIIGLKK